MASPFRYNKKARRRTRKSVKQLTQISQEGIDPGIAASVKEFAELVAQIGLARRKKRPKDSN